MKAAIYCRVSTTMQEDNYSLPTQEEACRKHAAALGYTVAEVHQDVHSGYELWERKGLTALREAARAGAYDAIIAYEPDRLSRRQIHSAVLIDECERYGVALLFVNGQHDKTALGEFLANVRAFTAEMEREKFRERSMRGIHARMRSGKLRPSNRPLFGYRWIDEGKGAYEIDEDKAIIVRRIFALAATGTPLRGIATILESEGIPTANGAIHWHASVIRTMLRHQAYAGIAVGNSTTAKKVGGKQIRDVRPESEHIYLPEGTIPALVSREMYEAVGTRLVRNKAEATRNSRDPEAFLLRAGFVVCGYCGKPIRGVWTKDCPSQHARAYYTCDPASAPHRDCPAFAMSAKKLDAAVWTKVKTIITRPEVIAEEVAKLRTNDPTDADLTAIERAITEIDRKRTNLSRSLEMIDDADTAAPIIAQLKALAARKRELDTERDAVKARQASWQTSQDHLTSLQVWAVAVSSNVEELTYQERRDLLSALDVRVRLYRKDHTPRYEITASLPFEPDMPGDIVSQPYVALCPLRSARRAFARQSCSFLRRSSRRSARTRETGHAA
jgi:site-specific DNA recombinase